ncbi:MAG: hypothetical protein ABI811_09865 [Acidobacteriota bacterium]
MESSSNSVTTGANTTERMDKQSKTKTSVYLPENLFWKFKEEVVRRRLASDTAAMEVAIRQWVEQDAGHERQAAEETRGRNKRLREMLDQILNSGDDEAVAAVRQSIQAVFKELKTRDQNIHLQASARRGEKR